jgi:predicted lipoprotein with Yx(FWY)xxD motif
MTPLTTRGRRFVAAGGAVAIAAAASAVPAMAVSKAHHTRAVTASATTVSAAKTSAGTILLAPNGHTLYAFSKDKKNMDVCASRASCLSIWPMFTAKGSVTAGPGVKQSLLGTITVKGKKQVTYAGHPLYTYTGDEGPKDVGYIGLSNAGGTWPAVSPAGSFVK